MLIFKNEICMSEIYLLCMLKIVGGGGSTREDDLASIDLEVICSKYWSREDIQSQSHIK